MAEIDRLLVSDSVEVTILEEEDEEPCNIQTNIS